MPLRLLNKIRKPERHTFESLVAGNHVVLMHDGDLALAAIASAIETAEHEILLEMYWFASDRIGKKIADLLEKKARAGVDIKILYDAVGSWETDPRMFEQLRDAGCQVKEYHPVYAWRRRFKLSLINYRDHRKILVVDNGIGITGGMNICDLWTKGEDGSAGWRDDAIQIKGPAVTQLRDVFFETWSGQSESTSLGTRDEQEHVQSTVAAQDFAAHTCSVAVLANRHRGHKGAIRRAYLNKIRSAKTFIYISNSYFIPDRHICRALAQAVRRGVDVRVLVPAVSDVPAVYYASRRMFGWLLNHGIQIYLWAGGVLHAKTAVIDAHWSTIGTHNLDHRSWYHNLEVNVAVEDENVGRAMMACFHRDLENSESILLENWRFRPLLVRLVERFFYAFRWLL
ncbi:MAG: cardiolipin synthase [Myxococcales bacterium]|nr:cardiolipin synthase [Myxococcales bacterium]